MPLVDKHPKNCRCYDCDNDAVNAPAMCHSCGTEDGLVEGSDPVACLSCACPKCGGSGFIAVNVQGSGEDAVEVECDECP